MKIVADSRSAQTWPSQKSGRWRPSACPTTFYPRTQAALQAFHSTLNLIRYCSSPMGSGQHAQSHSREPHQAGCGWKWNTNHCLFCSAGAVTDYRHSGTFTTNNTTICVSSSDRRQRETALPHRFTDLHLSSKEDQITDQKRRFFHVKRPLTI